MPLSDKGLCLRAAIADHYRQGGSVLTPIQEDAGATRGPLLTVEAALALAGDGVSRRWLLRATRGFKWRRDLTRKKVLFEEVGFRRWLMGRRTR